MLVALCLLSCLPVQINGLAAPDARDQSRFEIVPGRGKADDDLLFQELADEAGRTLAMNGFEPASGSQAATVSVALTWRVAKAPRRGKPKGSDPAYTRTLTLKAYDLTAPGKGRARKALWETIMVSEGRDDDMRTVAPVMFAVAGPYLSQNTGKAISVWTSPKRDTIRYIHGDIPAPPAPAAK
jgi:hypothetical protein